MTFTFTSLAGTGAAIPGRMEQLLGVAPHVPMTLMTDVMATVGKWHRRNCKVEGCGVFLSPGYGGLGASLVHGVQLPAPAPQEVPGA